MKRYNKVLEEIAKRYNLTKDQLYINHEYIGRYNKTWYAIIAIHMESNTCYLAQWNDMTGYKEIDIRKYNDFDNPNALTDLYQFIIA